MDKPTLVAYMMKHAQHDIGINGRGRILIPDLQAELPEPTSPQEMMDAWRDLHSDIPISQPTKNVLLVDFDFIPCPKHLPKEIVDELVRIR